MERCNSGCCVHKDNKVQKLNEFTLGKSVGFTDAFLKLPSSWLKDGDDWVVADEANKDGVLVVQRFGRPWTKVGLHWHWLYLK